MLGPMGARIIDLLKIMTPNEIDKYVETKDESDIELKLASGGEEFDAVKSHRKVPIKALKREREDEEDEEDIDHGAKIIPLKKEFEEEPSKEERNSSKNQLEKEVQKEINHKSSKYEKDLESAGIFSADKIEVLKRQKIAELKSKQDSTTNFILDQREKLKKTKIRLIELEAIKNYNTSQNVESLNDEVDLENPEDEVSHGSKGILINKKHY